MPSGLHSLLYDSAGLPLSSQALFPRKPESNGIIDKLGLNRMRVGTDGEAKTLTFLKHLHKKKNVRSESKASF